MSHICAKLITGLTQSISHN